MAPLHTWYCLARDLPGANAATTLTHALAPRAFVMHGEVCSTCHFCWDGVIDGRIHTVSYTATTCTQLQIGPGRWWWYCFTTGYCTRRRLHTDAEVPVAHNKRAHTAIRSANSHKPLVGTMAQGANMDGGTAEVRMGKA